jgi:hypothetical protein
MLACQVSFLTYTVFGGPGSCARGQYRSLGGPPPADEHAANQRSANHLIADRIRSFLLVVQASRLHKQPGRLHHK